MKVSIIIPARMASTRLPEKPLADILGKSLIMRAYDQAKKSKLTYETVVATDHKKIFNHVDKHGGKVIMTSDKHISGTDRIAEVAKKLDSDIIINLQGDEPLIDPLQIDELIQAMMSNDVLIGTQCSKLQNPDDLFDYNVVKVVRDFQNKALYFSRQAIPAFRDLSYRLWLENATYFRHVGMYGFKRDTLSEITKLQPSSYEKAESLEQLRWIENGYPIHCFETQYKSVGVDTAEDLEQVRDILLREMFH